MLYPLNSTPQVQPVKVHKKKEQWEKSEQKTTIVETEKLKGKNKIKRHIKLLWKVVVSSRNNVLFEKTLKDYLNTIMWN